MKIIVENKKEESKILNEVKNLLSKNKLLTLSTYKDNQPYSNTAFYVFDKEFNLYIWSEQNTLHNKNISKNNKVSINIFNSNQPWGSLLQGVQALGNAYPASNKELLKVGFLYLKRFPKSLKLVKNPKNFHNKIFQSKMYKIQLNKIKLFDEKTFGKYETREIIIKR